MSLGKGNSPKPPSPDKTASAQTATNIGTATANSYLNNVNQVGPDGNVGYSIDGYTDYTDPLSGKIYKIPKWTQTTTLSEQAQNLRGINDQTDINLATMGRDQSAKVSELLSKPVDLSNEATEGRLFDLGRARFDPQRAEQDEALRTRLANQGIGVGSEAYDREMRGFNEGWNDRYNQLMLTGRAQSVQEALQERNQPLNEIIGITNGTQVQLPQFGATNNYGIPTVDYAGLTQDNYRARLANYQQQQAQTQGVLGGLFGIAGAAAGNPAAFSDRRLKENIKHVATTPNGMKIKSYNMKGDNRPQMGLIAQEVRKKNPGAVMKDRKSGFLMVDYAKALKEARS